MIISSLSYLSFLSFLFSPSLEDWTYFSVACDNKSQSQVMILRRYLWADQWIQLHPKTLNMSLMLYRHALNIALLLWSIVEGKMI